MKILTVCSANLVRSPVAEVALRAALTAAGASGHDVVSAGVAASAGQRPPPILAQVLEPFGLDVSDHVSRQVTRDDVREADLVLAMTEEQRDQVRALLPAVTPRSFTLKEFVRVARAVPGHGPAAGSGAEIVRRLHAARPQVAAATTAEDVADPSRATAGQLRGCVREIAGLVDVVADRLA